jgi:hypothetical protein
MHKKMPASLTVIFLIAASVRARPVPIGTVTICVVASIDGTELVPGSTIFSDDTIDVGPGGSAWIAARGGAQIRVFENSTVRFASNENSIQVTVGRGLAKANSQNIVVRTLPPAEGLHPVSAEARRTQKDCEISKASTKNKACTDSVD